MDDDHPSTIEDPGSESAAARRAQWRVRLGLVLVVLAVVGPFVSEWSAQSGSRYGLTAALVDEGTVRIDSYREGTAPIDRVESPDGHLYSDKSPGQPVYAAPFYAVARAVGAEPATVIRIHGNLGLWWVTFWSSMVPTAAIVVLMYELARRHHPDTAVPAALALWGGTMWLVLSSELYGHALATLAAFAAWFLLADRRPTATRAAAAGLLVGVSVATEYPMALVAVVLGGLLLAKRAWGPLVAYAAGGIPGAVLLFGYQQAAFGSALRDSYGQKEAAGSDGVLFGLPDVGTFLQVVAGYRGLIFEAIIIVGAVGLVRMLVKHEPGREHAIVGLAIFGGFLLLQSSWPNPWGGEVPGPRYLMPAVPWLAVPVASMWKPFRTICVGVTAVGAAFMSLPLLTSHIIAHGASFLTWYPDVIRTDGFDPTLFTLAIGPVGWVVHLAAIAAAVWFLRTSWFELRDQGFGPSPLTPSRAAPA